MHVRALVTQLATISLAAAATDINFEGIIFKSPGRITNIGVTYIIPTTPHEPSLKTQQGFWMGLQPGTGPGAVLQNVVGNIGAVVGEWDFWPEFCCNPNVVLEAGQKVYAGDKVVNNLELDTSSGHWLDRWSVYRGSAAGDSDGFSGSFVFKPESYQHIDDFSMVLFTVELGQGAQWDFGAVVFEDIYIAAESTDTHWCTTPIYYSHSSPWTVTQPVASSDGKEVKCCVEQIALNGP